MTSGDTPAATKLGLMMYLASLALGLMKILILGSGSRSIAGKEAFGPAFGFLVGTFVFVLMLWLMLMIHRRRNWARIVLGVFCGLGLLASPWTAGLQYSAGLISGLLFSIQGALQALGTILLFLPSSNRWFRGQTGTPSNPS